MPNTPQRLISAIVAMAENGVIGQNNRLPWHLPADLKHFKAITTGHPILMGRKTYESIGKPLPNRTNFVISRNQDFHASGCHVVGSLSAAIEQAQPLSSEIFIIGGAQLYQQAMPLIQKLYLTIVHHAFNGDAFFPDWHPDAWQELSREDHAADAQNPYPYSFSTLLKKRV